MRRAVVRLCSATVLLIFAAAAGGAMADEVAQGLRLQIVGDRTQVSWTPHGALDPGLRLTFRFENRGPRPLKLDLNERRWGEKLEIEVRFEGQPVASAPRMDRIPKAVSPGAERIVTLALGRSFEWSQDAHGQPFTLPEFGSRMFLFEKPGTYGIRAVYTKDRVDPGNAFEAGCWTGTVTSNEIALEVRDPRAGQ